MPFDPYESWLGITADRQPPTYYDLLGLSAFESDPETIEQAALRRMSKVRQHQIGKHSDVSQEILAELARARLILIDPDRRADYDAKIRARGERPPKHSVGAEKNPLVNSVTDTAVPVPEGLDIFAQVRTEGAPRPSIAVDIENQISGDSAPAVAAPTEGGLEHFASISIHGIEDSISVRNPKKKKRPALWKNRLFVAAFLSTHLVLIGVFFAYGSAIALYMRSLFSGTNSTASTDAQKPALLEGQPGTTVQNPIDPNRRTPTTWLRFDHGTRITVAKSADFNMSEHDFTIFARIKTGKGGTVFSKAPAAGGLAPGASRLFIRKGSLAFESHGSPPVATAGRQVDDELWHDVAVTYAGESRNLILFIDGYKHGPGTIAATRDVSGHVIRIGSVATDLAADESQHFAGLIAEVRFYQRALTAQEIACLPSRDPERKPPLAHWKLREGGSRSVRDQTGHGHGGLFEEGVASDDTKLASNAKTNEQAGSVFPSKKRPPTSGDTLPNDDDRGSRELAANLGQTTVQGDDGPKTILEKHGLKVKGQICVLATEEDDVQTKVTESLLLVGKIQYHLLQKRSALNAALRPQMITDLQSRITGYQQEIQMTDQTIRAIPRFRGQFWSILEQARHDELVAYKSRLDAELAQTRGFLKDLKSLPADQVWSQRAEDLAMADLNTFDRILGELRELVDAANRKIDSLKRNPDIKKAIEDCAKLAGKPAKLGSSPEFAKNVGQLENLERDRRRIGTRAK